MVAPLTNYPYNHVRSPTKSKEGIVHYENEGDTEGGVGDELSSRAI